MQGEAEEQNRRLREALLRAQRDLKDFEEMPRDDSSLVKWEVIPDKWQIKATLPNEILFAAGSAKLKKGTIKELDEVFSVLRSRYGDKEISVVGHTDSDPIKKSNWADNWQLSTERSLEVVRELVKKGWPKGRIVASGAGENRPVGGNGTVTEKAKNRRVEIVVHML